MDRIYLDTETCGFHGPIVLIQHAVNDGPVQMHSVWTSRISTTLRLIESLCEGAIVGFNLTFDWFHINQTYNVLKNLLAKVGDVYPCDHISQYALLEADSRLGVCLKPVSALDLMLHARKGPYQSMMDRDDIRIKRIPTLLAFDLAELLDRMIPFKDIYFARKKDKKKRWKVCDIVDDVGEMNPDFKDLVLTFAPSSKLKVLAQDALGYEEVMFFEDVEVPESARPEEHGFAPFATAIGLQQDWKRAWPDVIRIHITHWAYNERARKYAESDIIYTRQLDYYFGARASGLSEGDARLYAREEMLAGYDLIPPGDIDSVLACMVGAVRWRGFSIDSDKLRSLHKRATDTQAKSKYNFNSTEVCRRYLSEVLSATEAIVLQKDNKITTKSIILEDIIKWREETVCDCAGVGCTKCKDGLITVMVEEQCKKCEGKGCKVCNNGTVMVEKWHPAALRAKEILDYRRAGKEIEIYDKLLVAGRFHVSLNVIGALSGRMSGSDGLNAQGIKRATEVRECFPLADSGYRLDGGDFAGFEVCLADAVYGDPDLRADLLTLRPCTKCAKWARKNGLAEGSVNQACDECKGTGQEGTKIHALFGQYLFPPMDYDAIYATKGLPGEQDKYSRSKNGVFALLYGGEAFTLVSRVGVQEATANEAYQRWVTRYVVWGQARRKIFESFCSMRQPSGLGSRVEWAEPAEYIETMFGFRRYFTVENMICKTLFGIAEEPPKEWQKIKLKVTRRDREQSVCGAVRSALFGAAFAIQAGNMRAAANHVIQGTGAQCTKELQTRIWTIQPSGVHEWQVVPFQVHDEIMAPTLPAHSNTIRSIVEAYVEEMKAKIPLLAIDWSQGLSTWAAK